MKQLILDIGLGVESTLNSFAPGENEAVLAHLRLWVGSPTRSPVPTYLWGGSGSGKTHLLKAVRHALTDRGVRVGWLDATASDAGEFDDSWGAVLMDDVDRLDSTGQQVAFNWFVNALSPSSGEARWVLACGAMPPADLALRDDLRSRLGWGHVFQLHPPSESERRAVLRKAADARGIFLADEVIDYILGRFPRDLGSLMALLERLDRFALQNKRNVTLPLLRAMLESE